MDLHEGFSFLKQLDRQLSVSLRSRCKPFTYVSDCKCIHSKCRHCVFPPGYLGLGLSLVQPETQLSLHKSSIKFQENTDDYR